MNDLAVYTIRRLFQGIFIVLAVTMILFTIMHMMPGDPIQLIGDPRMGAEKIAQLRQKWGLDKPAVVQYLFWLKNVLTGDMGKSITNGQSVSVLLMARLPFTLQITLTGLLIQYVIAVPLGLIAGIRQGSLFDRGAVFITSILRAIPYFWLGILLILIFSIRLKWLPVSGYRGPISLIMPVMTVTLPMLADTLRLTRSEVLEVLREKHVTTAIAKGLTQKAVILGHVLRNATGTGHGHVLSVCALAHRRVRDHRDHLCLARHGKTFVESHFRPGFPRGPGHCALHLHFHGVEHHGRRYSHRTS